MIATIYKGFAQSAAISPKNAKMILRHSLRDKIPPNETGNDILLTREGEVMAEHFGLHCNFSIAKIHTSIIERCIQTANLFAKGYKESKHKELEIIHTNILTDTYINDLDKAVELFKTQSPYSIISAFLRGESLPGMRGVEESMKTLFNYIFADKTCEDMEIFITHDTFLIAIVCYCHNLQPQLDDFNWPYMLEGAFLYLENNHIHCIFRGIDKSIPFVF
ncbi:MULTISPECIES: histidine phosphatase family protein [Helicobacter]|uniref:Histidine phosphatase family protein n=3 Tax=Helicobacter bilis TaxID=37372 RepID=C3XEB4_9HELI|nr:MULTISPECIES: histidine phosphatase family protein [Helicobacter]EEO23353.1 hypothetical protein HRAG_00410 [Helicobacter bilis ATCC 43879]EMZ37888.1 hypothetical protein C826_01971 [Helicobacter bilis WiWa]MDY5950661.1 histidine phosphatase family protein [Helicobacter sp.]TLE04018.1 histidine phosphatase family protein [Helicobacter bilis]TLE04811.1 histidine phosphatase family protein [Helicobacter bilis]